MKKLSNKVLKNLAGLFVLMALFLILLWRLGSYPDIFDSYVDFQIHPQVNKVFDNLVVPGEVTWLWQDMYQGQGGRSPVYGGVIELGLRLFGLTFFGIRIIPVIFALIALILLYTAVRRMYSNAFSLIFTALLGSATWFLVLARSGGFAGFSMVFFIFCIALLLHFIQIRDKNNKGNNAVAESDSGIKSNGVDNGQGITTTGRGKFSWEIAAAVLAGIAVALLPYTYVIIRPFFLLLPLYAVTYVRKINIRNIIIFLIPVLIVVTLQSKDIKSSAYNFFHARGESMYGVVQEKPSPSGMDEIKAKLIDNVKKESKFLLGLNHTETFWNPNIASSYWLPDIVVYPKFLVPFFILGLILYLVNIFRKKVKDRGLMLLILLAGAVPGIMSRTGEPNLARCSLMILPIYFFIAYAIYHLYNFLVNIRIGKIHIAKAKVAVAAIASVVFLLVTVTVAYQTVNFFTKDKVEMDERRNPANTMNKYLIQYFNKNKDAKVLINEFAPFGEYGSYTFVRCLGGKSFQEKVKSGQVKFVRNENIAELDKLLKNNYFDIVITSSDDSATNMLKTELPEFSNVNPEPSDNILVYHMKTGSTQSTSG